MATIDIFGVSSSSDSNRGFWRSHVSSRSDSLLSNSPSSFASHWYRFLVISFFEHLWCGSHFYLQYLHLPSSIHWDSKLVLLSLLRCGGQYFVSGLTLWTNFWSLSGFLFHVFLNFSSMILSLCLALSRVETFSSSS